ncbi:DUF185-domain-containing protein [Daedalea quercina L-15889]|uniref:Protein arginine methyltransferase NDUFAF7 n=1 Tax=Daedalea quercina L-15889 TaxID=1314783 RepID=A0A165NTV7_9APHY|nr:DUF185-domain-containing protein [Daedalea quercina L-15889]
MLASSSTRLAQTCRRNTVLFARTFKRKAPGKATDEKINYNALSFQDVPDAEHISYKRVTANDLESCTEPPRRVKMLVRDFIEDSLYNPHYGYFPKQADIFTATEPIQFGKLRNILEFEEVVARKYAEYGPDGEGPGRQIWHTPTELFKPWYGQAIAQCLLSEYLLKYFPYDDFVIYEIGAGNGTLALDILDYIQDRYPDVYDRTRYKIIEISESLANLQREKLSSKHPCVEVHNQSIFRWSTREPAPCFFLAMEVIDNFAHDMIRYDLRTLEPYQGLVTIDAHGDFSTLLRTLRRHFPRHRLLLSDFASLPDTVPGANAPVVQTRYRNTTVPCTTFLVKQGYFDIFFPTDFEHLRDMYEHILAQPLPLAEREAPLGPSPLSTSASPLALGGNFFSSYHPKNLRLSPDGVASAAGIPGGDLKSSVYTHAEFMSTYANLSKTRLRNGENPILNLYQNVKFLF